MVSLAPGPGAQRAGPEGPQWPGTRSGERCPRDRPLPCSPARHFLQRGSGAGAAQRGPATRGVWPQDAIMIVRAPSPWSGALGRALGGFKLPAKDGHDPVCGPASRTWCPAHSRRPC